MTAVAKKIQQEIQQLALEDLLALHEGLIVSIHEKEDTQPLDSAFREEIERRVKDIDSGKAQGVDPFKALGEM
jgi:Putative addiction module component